MTSADRSADQQVEALSKPGDNGPPKDKTMGPPSDDNLLKSHVIDAERKVMNRSKGRGKRQNAMERVYLKEAEPVRSIGVV
jgi:hypothetical protein